MEVAPASLLPEVPKAMSELSLGSPSWVPRRVVQGFVSATSFAKCTLGPGSGLRELRPLRVIGSCRACCLVDTVLVTEPAVTAAAELPLVNRGAFSRPTMFEVVIDGEPCRLVDCAGLANTDCASDLFRVSRPDTAGPIIFIEEIRVKLGSS